VATALARYDLPVPGGPYNRKALQGFRFPANKKIKFLHPNKANSISHDDTIKVECAMLEFTSLSMDGYAMLCTQGRHQGVLVPYTCSNERTLIQYVLFLSHPKTKFTN
jgi:hypothetical protein